MTPLFSDPAISFQDAYTTYHVVFADDTVATVKARSATAAVAAARPHKRCEPVEVLMLRVDGRMVKLRGVP